MPTPAGPTTVTRRCPSSAARTAASSAARPTSAVVGAGRLPRGGPPSAGSWTSTWCASPASAGPGSTPSSSASIRVTRRCAASASAGRPARYSAVTSNAHSPSRNGCSATSASSSPDQLTGRPEREPRGELVLGQPQPHLGEPHPVRRHPVAVARGREHLGVEQLQARAAEVAAAAGSPSASRAAPSAAEPRRVQRVDGVGDERVARRAARHGRRVAQRPAQLRHLDLQRVRPGAAGPEVLGEPRRPYGATALEREPDQQLRGAPRRHRGRHPVAADDDAPEHRHGQHGAHGSGAGEPGSCSSVTLLRLGDSSVTLLQSPGPSTRRQRIVSGRADALPRGRPAAPPHPHR